MKIAVYGDSFAYSRNSLDTSWFSLLGKKLNCTVDTYGCSGTSVYYSYKQFMNSSYSDYDYIIFLVSEPSRYYNKVEFTTGDSFYLTGINDIEWFKNFPGFGPTDIELLNDIETWYKVTDFNYVADMAELMMDSICSIRNDVIFAPCFETSFSEKWKLKEPNTIPLFELMLKQIELLGKTSLTFDLITREDHNVMSAHLTPEFNEFVADVMYDRITTGKWDFSELDNVKLLHKQDYYYKVD